jgi:Ser/Thr protein kinase RdoA (MazF antagonist)
MKPFASLTPRGKLGRVRALAKVVLARYDLPADSKLTMVNHTENVTYAVDPPGMARRYMRVHRTHYHTLRAIESELAWAKAVREDTGIFTPEAIPGIDGKLIQTVDHPGIDEARRVALFHKVEGRRISEQGDLIGPFGHLGATAARLHAHALAWKRPAWFERFSWDFEHAVGATPHWGPYAEAPGLSAGDLDLLGQTVEHIRIRLLDYGKAPERFGLVHADLRLDNLLIKGTETRLLDFDDCGFAWRLHDFGSAVTMLEGRPDMPQLAQAWLDGYRTLGTLDQADLDMVPTLVMVRRIAAAGWIASHAGTALAQTLGVPYGRTTTRLARDYLAERYLTDIK